MPSVPKIQKSVPVVQSSDRAPTEIGGGPAAHLGDDVHVVGHSDCLHHAVLVAAPVGEGTGHGRHLGGRADVAHDGLVPDAHAQDVVSAEGAVLPPVQRPFGVYERVGPVAAPVIVADPQADGQDVAQIAVADVLDDRVVHLQRLRSRDNLRDQIGMQAADVQHLVGLVGVHCHAGLGQHVLAGVQRGQNQVAVHIGPGADAYGVYAVVVQQVNPVVVYRGNLVLGGDTLAGLAAAVGDGDDVHVALLTEAGDVAKTGIGPGPYEADADDSVLHQKDSLGIYGVGQFYSWGIFQPQRTRRAQR